MTPAGLAPVAWGIGTNGAGKTLYLGSTNYACSRYALSNGDTFTTGNLPAAFSDQWTVADGLGCYRIVRTEGSSWWVVAGNRVHVSGNDASTWQTLATGTVKVRSIVRAQ